MLYRRPEIKSYSAGDLLEVMGPCQNQYTTTTLQTSTGYGSASSDGTIYYNFTSGFYAFGDATTPVIAGDIEGLGTMYGRGFAGFDISGISTVVSATLRIYQAGPEGSPYESLGSGVIVDHINFGSTLDASAGDFGNDSGNDALHPNIGTISTDSSQGWKTLAVTTYVQNDIDSGRTSSQFRFRFPINRNNDGGHDYTVFEDAEGNTGNANNRPQLVVTYR